MDGTQSSASCPLGFESRGLVYSSFERANGFDNELLVSWGLLSLMFGKGTFHRVLDFLWFCGSLKGRLGTRWNASLPGLETPLNPIPRRTVIILESHL